tara:strand:+ start:3557 stop:3805 length:249 start_codon:yes stop_codon:yes gene_type:complete
MACKRSAVRTRVAPPNNPNKYKGFRIGRLIDLEFYGFDNKYLKSLKSRIDNLDDIKLLERYSFNGAEKPQIEKNLSKEGWRR